MNDTTNVERAAHTPGPWSAFRYPDCRTWTVATVRSIASRIEREEDARLIAAAPDLLLVAQLANKMNRNTEGSGLLDLSVNDLRNLYILARKALAKVTGGQP